MGQAGYRRSLIHAYHLLSYAICFLLGLIAGIANLQLCLNRPGLPTFRTTRAAAAAGAVGFALEQDLTVRDLRRNPGRNGLALSLGVLAELTSFLCRIRSEGPHCFQVSSAIRRSGDESFSLSG